MKYLLFLPVLLAGHFLLWPAKPVAPHAPAGYDTSYTTVSFRYSKKIVDALGMTTISCSGTSNHAPMLSDGHGGATVFCADRVNAGADDPALQSMFQQAGAATGNYSRQIAFSNMSAQDHSLSGKAQYDALFNGGRTQATGTTKLVFTFHYDADNGVSYITVGAQVDTKTTSTKEGVTTVTTGAEGIGGAAFTNPAALYGSTASNGNDAYATITKTKSGYKASYTKITREENPSNGSTATTTETIDASIGEVQKPYEAVIQPVAFDYVHWLPRGPKTDGSDDTKGDNSARFNIIVQKKGDPSTHYEGTYTVSWSLKETTHYPGFCNNYPAYRQTPNTGADLVFDPSLSHDGNFATVNESAATTRKGAGGTAIIKLMSMDYAAWGKLSAWVTLEDGTTIAARPYYRSEDSAWLTIPYDRDENKLADAWEIKNKVHGKGHQLTDDKDEQNDQLDTGDGYTVFEEYRGFGVRDNALYKPDNNLFAGGHVRTDPAVKDAFIYDKDDLFKKYYAGVNPAQLNWHYVDPDWHQLIFLGEDHFEPEHRRVNFNKVDDYFYGYQYAMFLEKGIYAYDGKAVGITWSKAEYDFSNDLKRNKAAKDKMHQASAAENNISPAQRYFKCVIYLGKLKDAGSGILGLTDRGGPEANLVLYNKVVAIQTDIAVLHEIGHYLGISHHHHTTSICNKENTDLCDIFNDPTHDGAYDCLMRYPSLEQSFETGFLSTSFTRYCKKGVPGFDYIYRHVLKKDGTPERYASDNMAKFTTSTTPVTCQDNCWGQITIKTVPGK